MEHQHQPGAAGVRVGVRHIEAVRLGSVVDLRPMGHQEDAGLLAIGSLSRPEMTGDAFCLRRLGADGSVPLPQRVRRGNIRSLVELPCATESINECRCPAADGIRRRRTGRAHLQGLQRLRWGRDPQAPLRELRDANQVTRCRQGGTASEHDDLHRVIARQEVLGTVGEAMLQGG